MELAILSPLFVATSWPPFYSSVHYNLASFTITPLKMPSPRACGSATKFKGSFSTNSFIQQLFIERLLWARLFCAGDTTVTKTTKIPGVQRQHATNTSRTSWQHQTADSPDLLETKLPQLKGHCSVLVFLLTPWTCFLILLFLHPPLRAGIPRVPDFSFSPHFILSLDNVTHSQGRLMILRSTFPCQLFWSSRVIQYLHSNVSKALQILNTELN